MTTQTMQDLIGKNRCTGVIVCPSKLSMVPSMSCLVATSR